MLSCGPLLWLSPLLRCGQVAALCFRPQVGRQSAGGCLAPLLVDESWHPISSRVRGHSRLSVSDWTMQSQFELERKNVVVVLVAPIFFFFFLLMRRTPRFGGTACGMSPSQ